MLYNLNGGIMKTIKKNIDNEIIVNKSKFITYLFKVYNEEEALSIISRLKKQYKDATHYCYAYIINDIKRFSDDKEPSGTAGVPIMEVLLKNELNLILCVVIRYFGGVKLGTGGLTRAYSKSASEALKKSIVVNLIEAKRYEIIFDYENSKEIDYLLLNYNIENKIYDNNIKYIVNIPIFNKDNLINQLNNLKNIKIRELKDNYIED